MKTCVAIDQVGRMVLPKPIRESLGLFGRGSVMLEVIGSTARITAADEGKNQTSRKRGRLVFSGALPEDWNSGEAIESMRRTRISR
jgi:hypothetical protein